MAIHVTSINGMGASTYSSGTITNTGMADLDHMHLANDLITTGGTVLSTDLAVTQKSSPNMSVDVAAGTCYVLNAAWSANSISATRYWRATNSASVNVSVAAADGALNRIDLVCVKVNTVVAPDATASNVATVVSSGDDAALKGTPGGSPSAPAVPSNYLVLAQVYVGTGVTQILTANITDRRVRTALTTVNQTLTTPTITAPTITGAINTDGWSTLSGTFTRTSAYIITVADLDPSTCIGIGDKLKVTDTTTKYFSVVGVDSTTITITAGASYTLVGNPAAISFAHGTAAGWPTWFSLGTPTWTTSGTAFTNQPINNAWYFNINGRTCSITGLAQTHGTSGGTGHFIATFTTGYLPVADYGAGGAWNLSSVGGGNCISAAGGNNYVTIFKYDGTAIATNNQYFSGSVSFKI